MDKIIKLVNNNKTISIIIVVILIVYILSLYNEICLTENFDSTTQQCTQSNNTDVNFKKSYVDNAKMINFKCTYKNKDYYLACVKIESCTNITQPLASSTEHECITSAVILIDKEDIQNQLITYNDTINDATALCNYKLELVCGHKHENEKLSEEELAKICHTKNDACINTRKYIHDFIVTAIPQTDPSEPSQNKYYITGNGAPYLNNLSINAILNQQLNNYYNNNLLCGDYYNYNSDKKYNSNVEIQVIEKNTNTTVSNIIGGSDNLTVLLKFISNVYINDIDPVTKKPKIVQMFDGAKMKKKTTYIGVSQDKTCTFNGKSYPRVCLYDTFDDPSVLYFTPIVV